MSRMSSPTGRTSANGVPASRESGSTMIPPWSCPSSSSRSERIIPSETSPRSLRRSIVNSPPGMTPPGSTTATVAPAPKFHAPQTIDRGSPLPTSTRVSWSLSAFGCLPASSTFPTTKCSLLSPPGTPRRTMRSTSQLVKTSRRASSSRGTSKSTYSRSQLTGTFISGHHRGSSRRLPREKQARQGRRERAYRGCTDATEDAASRSFAAGRWRLMSRWWPLELSEDAEVVLPERTQVRQAVPEHGDALDAEPECEALVLVGIDADVPEDVGVDPAGAAHLDPARVLARRASVAAADEARHVELDRRLGEREKTRPHAHLARLAEQRAEELQHRPLQVGERDAAVDGQALDLQEDRRVGRVGRVAAVAATGRDQVDRRLPRLHRADLFRRGVRAQHCGLVDVEGVELRARRMA